MPPDLCSLRTVCPALWHKYFAYAEGLVPNPPALYYGVDGVNA